VGDMMTTIIYDANLMTLPEDVRAWRINRRRRGQNYMLTEPVEDPTNNIRILRVREHTFGWLLFELTVTPPADTSMPSSSSELEESD